VLIAGSPGVAVGQASADPVRPRYNRADVDFMQGMIAHHGQALVMSGLVPTRTRRAALKLLAERITVSQQDEIRLMRTWLLDRGESAPAPDHPAMDHHDHGAMALMPGMLTEQQLDRLKAARGSAFDRLLLESMIRHHEGALTMVATLFGTPGAGQDVDIFRFASDVDADQRAEIARMRALLKPMKESQ
jgi:uncharacterized protein (DUF305 family)